MDPQQAHYQFRWLKVFRAHLDLSIYDLLSAICYLLSAAINGRDELQLVRIVHPGAPVNLGRAGARPYRLLQTRPAQSAMGYRLLLQTLLPFPAITAITALPAFLYE